MRLALLLTIAMFAASPAFAEMSFVGAGQDGVMSDDFYGCRTQDDETAFRKLVSEGDKPAAVRFGDDKYPACKYVTSSTRGHVEDLSFMHETSCFRPRGEPYCLWLPTHFIAKP